jgi:DNA-binding MarR family transcriptional regulator
MSPSGSRILRELKQNKPFRSDMQEAAVALMRTADVVRRAGAAVIEPLGITVQQYNVLRILRGAGKAGLPTLEVAERMIEQTPGITRLVDRLEAKKLARRERCLHDRRQIFCHITEGGLALLARLDDPVLLAHHQVLEMLGPRDVEQLLSLLDRIRESAERSQPV